MVIDGRLVVAACRGSGGIGINGTLPWPHLSEDMKNFKRITAGSAVLMGSATYKSLPDGARPLPGRLNIVLTSQSREELGCSDSVMVADGFEAAAEILRSRRSQIVYVIGGASVYEEALKLPEWSRRIFYTEVFNDFRADRQFPLDLKSEDSGFDLVSLGDVHEENGVKFQACEYVRSLKEGPSASLVQGKTHAEYQYLELAKRILETGVDRGDRTGVGTRSLFGVHMRFDLRDSFPLLTTKRVFWRGVAEELFWFISGQTNANLLSEKGIRIWNGNGSREFLDSRGFTDRDVGDLGPVYGFQWRHFGADYTDMYANYDGQGVDQLGQVIDTIRRNPTDRRILLSAWNPCSTSRMALPPCHLLAQFHVANGELSCQMYQRSGDVGLGVPFNIASYSLLTCLIASVTGLKPGEFVHVIGDTHIYNNHKEALRTQITRKPRPFPRLIVRPRQRIEDFTFQDLTLEGYEPHGSIAMKMAV